MDGPKSYAMQWVYQNNKKRKPQGGKERINIGKKRKNVEEATENRTY